jgi:hypothetical protein
MAYRTSIRRVRDESLPLGWRYGALRSAVGYYCPLGFQATWAYVASEARPWGGRRWDGAALVRAIELLEDSRAVWLAELDAFAAARRTEKTAGRRCPRDADLEHLHGPRWPSTRPPSQLGLVAAVAAQHTAWRHTRLPDELANLRASLDGCALEYINRLGYVDDELRELLYTTADDIRRWLVPGYAPINAHLAGARRLGELLRYAVSGGAGGQG